MKADALWDLGITGACACIAIIEDSRVDFNNSCLSANNLGTRVPNDPEVDDHATACAGIAASTHNDFGGIAPGAGIYSSNIVSYANFANIAAATDAAAQNADISNNSWGLKIRVHPWLKRPLCKPITLELENRFRPESELVLILRLPADAHCNFPNASRLFRLRHQAQLYVRSFKYLCIPDYLLAIP